MYGGICYSLFGLWTLCILRRPRVGVCVLFWGAHKSLAPRARTLLGVLGQATLIFFAVATLLFFVFCECPKFCDGGFLRSEKMIFRFIFSGCASVSWFFIFFCCNRARPL